MRLFSFSLIIFLVLFSASSYAEGRKAASADTNRTEDKLPERSLDGELLFDRFNPQTECIVQKEEVQQACGNLPDPQAVGACLDCAVNAQNACLSTQGAVNVVSGCNPEHPSIAHSPNAPPAVECHAFKLECELACSSLIGGMNPLELTQKSLFISGCQNACIGAHSECITGMTHFFSNDSGQICESAAQQSRSNRDAECDANQPDDPAVRAPCLYHSSNTYGADSARCSAGFAPRSLL